MRVVSNMDEDDAGDLKIGDTYAAMEDGGDWLTKLTRLTRLTELT